jgi:hypothetical protein
MTSVKPVAPRQDALFMALPETFVIGSPDRLTVLDPKSLRLPRLS